ncbi:hypothetical protein [Cellulomonas bogoriensis]|nr:hypothetical protein [Cellulomonas bogoriensis]
MSVDPSPLRGAWAMALVGALVLGVWLIATWWAADLQAACPAGTVGACDQATRVAVARVATVVSVLTYVLVLVVALLVRRRRGVLGVLALVLLAVSGFVGFALTLTSTGFVLE